MQCTNVSIYTYIYIYINPFRWYVSVSPKFWAFPTAPPPWSWCPQKKHRDFASVSKRCASNSKGVPCKRWQSFKAAMQSSKPAKSPNWRLSIQCVWPCLELCCWWQRHSPNPINTWLANDGILWMVGMVFFDLSFSGGYLVEILFLEISSWKGRNLEWFKHHSFFLPSNHKLYEHEISWTNYVWQSTGWSTSEDRCRSIYSNVTLNVQRPAMSSCIPEEQITVLFFQKSRDEPPKKNSPSCPVHSIILTSSSCINMSPFFMDHPGYSMA